MVPYTGIIWTEIKPNFCLAELTCFDGSYYSLLISGSILESEVTFASKPPNLAWRCLTPNKVYFMGNHHQDHRFFDVELLMLSSHVIYNYSNSFYPELLVSARDPSSPPVRKPFSWQLTERHLFCGYHSMSSDIHLIVRHETCPTQRIFLFFFVLYGDILHTIHMS